MLIVPQSSKTQIEWYASLNPLDFSLENQFLRKTCVARRRGGANQAQVDRGHYRAQDEQCSYDAQAA